MRGNAGNVFSLAPPPLVLVTERLKMMEGMKNANLSTAIKHLSGSVEKLKAQNRQARKEWQEEMRYEQLMMIEDLKKEGMKIRSDIDFLFFDFRQTSNGDLLKIDVFGGMQSPMDGNKNNREYIQFFEKMGETATRSYEKGDSVEQFVKSLQLRWSGRIAINKTTHVSQYLSFFLGAFGPKAK